jgi:hypothetical protein
MLSAQSANHAPCSISPLQLQGMAHNALKTSCQSYNHVTRSNVEFDKVGDSGAYVIIPGPPSTCAFTVMIFIHRMGNHRHACIRTKPCRGEPRDLVSVGQFDFLRPAPFLSASRDDSVSVMSDAITWANVACWQCCHNTRGFTTVKHLMHDRRARGPRSMTRMPIQCMPQCNGRFAPLWKHNLL